MNNNIKNYSADDSDPPDTTTDHAPPRSTVIHDVAVGVSSSSSTAAAAASLTRTRNPRKKRTTKLIRIMDSDDGSTIVRSNTPSKPYYKKPDPNAPKITRPCSECGKKFWSWKALFGHMRCHPERQWRGINPPPNHHILIRHQPRPPQPPQPDKDDYEVAECLLLLANGKENNNNNNNSNNNKETVISHYHHDDDDVACPHYQHEQERFECSSCKKVFGSHQALGGHRASHKNVKGCFAITRTSTDPDNPHAASSSNYVASSAVDDDDEEMTMMIDGGGGAVVGHKCSICLRVFSTGQALGGHKRCHWEKSDVDPTVAAAPPAPAPDAADLNLPPPPPDAPAVEEHCSSLSSSSSLPLTLDLRLGL